MPVRSNRVNSGVALTFWASFLNVAGLLRLIVSIASWVMSAFTLTAFLVYGVGCSIGAFVTSALLRGVAEIVRVLKRNAGLQYIGAFGEDLGTVPGDQ